jgi:metal-responsive CopG/Arc/MetJ family transcriptional regulator
MRNILTVSLSAEIRKELDLYSQSEGISRSDVVRESVRDYLFVHQLRSLRRRMLPKAAAQGVHTDQDVFG